MRTQESAYIKANVTEYGIRWELWLRGQMVAASTRIAFVAAYLTRLLQVQEEFQHAKVDLSLIDSAG